MSFEHTQRSKSQSAQSFWTPSQFGPQSFPIQEAVEGEGGTSEQADFETIQSQLDGYRQSQERFGHNLNRVPIFRKHQEGRDDNGVAAYADQSVGRASLSVSQPLPQVVRARFEDSLGMDLSGVRVHTGSESADAAHAVGARAYTTGQDIHFGEGEYRPNDSEGMHLLAHEVAHTVQQQGATPTRQNKLSVSSSGDAAEVEADRAADAMVSGIGVSIGSTPADGNEIHRQPSWRGRDTPKNSYNRGGDLVWSGGSTLMQDEMKEFANLKCQALLKATALSVKALAPNYTAEGVVDKLKEEAEQRIDGDIQLRRYEIGWLESEVKYLEGLDEKDLTPYLREELKTKKERLKKAEEELERIKEGKSDAIEAVAKKAIEIGDSIAKYGEYATAIGSKFTGLISDSGPELFDNMEGARGKLDKFCKAADVALGFYDTSALDNFKANPNFETAKAWGAKVGDVFNSVSGLVDGLPTGWNDVIKGVLKMPKVVITNFTELVESRYKEVDALLHSEGTSKLLPGGTYG